MTKQLDNVALAYLCTPTDTHLIPASAKAATRTNRARAPLWQVVARLPCRCLCIYTILIKLLRY